MKIVSRNGIYLKFSFSCDLFLVFHSISHLWHPLSHSFIHATVDTRIHGQFLFTLIWYPIKRDGLIHLSQCKARITICHEARTFCAERRQSTIITRICRCILAKTCNNIFHIQHINFEHRYRAYTIPRWTMCECVRLQHACASLVVNSNVCHIPFLSNLFFFHRFWISINVCHVCGLS